MYEVGDVVAIRSWKSLVNEFGIKEHPHFISSSPRLNVDIYFTRNNWLSIYGRSFPIQRIHSDGLCEIHGTIVGLWAFDYRKQVKS